MFAPAAASNALSDELVAAPGHGQSNQKLVTVPLLNGGQSRLTLATLPRPQEELARHRLSAAPDGRRSCDHGSGRSRKAVANQASSPGSSSSWDVRTDERSGTLQNYGFGIGE